MSLRRRTIAVLAALSAVATAGAVLLLPQAAAAANTAYVMAYFTESPQQQAANYGLHLAVSQDGLNWTPLNQNNPVATPTAGTLGLRDPFVLRKQDGTFVVLATDLNGTNFSLNSQYLHVWDSTNLTSFTGYRRIRMHTLNTHTWAPTAFWDAARGQYGIVYSANNGTDVFMVNYTTDFRTVTSNQVYFSPGFPVLDGDIVVDGSTFYLYYKTSPTACSTGPARPPARRTATPRTPAGCARAAPSRHRCWSRTTKATAGGCGATPSARSTTTTTPGPPATSAGTRGR